MAIVFTTIGVTDVIDILDGSRSTATAWYIGIGTGGSGTSASAAVGDVDLFVPFTTVTATKVGAIGRVSATGESQPSSAQLQWKAKLGNGDTVSRGMEEVGLYIADNGGSSTSTSTTLWVHANYPTINLATADAIEFTITLTAS